MKPCTSENNIRECFDRGGDMYQSLKELIQKEPIKYGSLIADIMKIRCVGCEIYPEID